VDKQNKVDNLTNILDGFFEELSKDLDSVESNEKYIECMKFLTRFHNYSINNRILIYMQKPDSMRVGSFNKWKEVGRCVKKGEKGIQILAPITKRIYINESEVAANRANGRPVFRTKNNKPYTLSASGFRVQYVFDISQTEGDDPPEMFFGGKASGGIESDVDRLSAVCDELGITLSFEDTGSRNCKGYSKGGSIVVDPDLDLPETISVLSHELAHEILHWTETRLEDNHSKSFKEVEAESTAYIVGSYIGLDLSESSSFYIHGWANGADSAKDKIKESMTRISRASKIIIDGYDKHKNLV